jgi:F-type H+-transporting ATPase subunit b
MHETSIWAEPRTWVIIAFFIFFALFGRKLWSVIAQMLDNRAVAVRTELEEAARLRREAEAMLRDAQERRAAAVRDAQAMLEGAGAEAAQVAAQARADAEASMRRRERMATDRIQAAEAAAVAEVRRAAVEVATQAATQVLAGGLGAGTDTALVDRAIAGLPAALTGRRAA